MVHSLWRVVAQTVSVLVYVITGNVIAPNVKSDSTISRIVVTVTVILLVLLFPRKRQLVAIKTIQWVVICFFICLQIQTADRVTSKLHCRTKITFLKDVLRKIFYVKMDVFSHEKRNDFGWQRLRHTNNYVWQNCIVSTKYQYALS